MELVLCKSDEMQARLCVHYKVRAYCACIALNMRGASILERVRCVFGNVARVIFGMSVVERSL